MLTFPGNVFPIGTHVYREPHQDMDELLRDLPVLADHGFNMIKIQESWCIDEPREGEIDLSRIERVIERAGELGLGVYVGLTMEQVPMWAWKKFPDCRLVYADGRRHEDPTQYCLPADGKPGPCWDHPGIREAAVRFIRELAARLGRFDNIWCWNTFQEIGFRPNTGGPLGVCYCEHTLARYREWLQTRYESLDAANATWQTAYGAWDEVEPPRRAAHTPPFIDWRYFMEHVYMTSVLEHRTAALREGDPKQRPVFAHVASPYIGSDAEWDWAAVGDLYGKSCYPTWSPFHPWEDAARRKSDRHTTRIMEIFDAFQFKGDYCRSATGRGKPTWAAEFQGGPVCQQFKRGRVPDAGDIRRWMLAGLASGMHGISFWNHRAERFWPECNGFSLLDPLGDHTDRIEEAGRVARAVNEEPDLFAVGETPPAKVAILVNDDLHTFCLGSAQNAAEHLRFAVRGHYHRLWWKGVPVDFLSAKQVFSGGLSGYAMAILPFPVALDAAYFAVLAEWVADGGMLVSDACIGRWDRYGFCTRTQMVEGAEDVFGVAHRDVRLVAEPGGETRWSEGNPQWGDYADACVLEGEADFSSARLRASFLLQTFEPDTAQPILLHDGVPAAVINQYEKGKAVLFGTMAGHSALAHRLDDEENPVRFFGGRPEGGLFDLLLKRADVEPDRAGELIIRRRVLGEREAWFLINPTDEDMDRMIPMDDYVFDRALMDDMVLTHGDDRVAVRVPAEGVSCILVHKGH